MMARKLELCFLGGRRYRLKVYNFLSKENRYSYDPANTFTGEHGAILAILDAWKEHLERTGQRYIETRG